MKKLGCVCLGIDSEAPAAYAELVWMLTSFTDAAGVLSSSYFGSGVADVNRMVGASTTSVWDYLGDTVNPDFTWLWLGVPNTRFGF